MKLDTVAIAQVSGDILVSRAASPLAPLVPAEVAAGESVPADDDPGSAARPTGGLLEPRAVTLPEPVYPRAARASRQEGRVTVCFTVDERGRVRVPAVRASSDPVFNQPSLDAIAASRFTPARVGSRTIRSTACRTFQYVLR